MDGDRYSEANTQSFAGIWPIWSKNVLLFTTFYCPEI
jgi:hypothetical protein